MWSVLSVETSGSGYLADRRPKILFERHVFHGLTLGRYDASHPDISQPTAGGYGDGGANQYNRLAAAITLDRDSALKSASWGLGQIMGGNFKVAGFAGVENMVSAMILSEDSQLAAMASFLSMNLLSKALAAHDWAAFARGYNGPDYAKNAYDEKLGHFYAIYSTGGPPSLDVREAQLLLTYHGVVIGVDGIMGRQTEAAITQFQKDEGLDETGQPDAATLAQLRAKPFD